MQYFCTASLLSTNNGSFFPKGFLHIKLSSCLVMIALLITSKSFEVYVFPAVNATKGSTDLMAIQIGSTYNNTRRTSNRQ